MTLHWFRPNRGYFLPEIKHCHQGSAVLAFFTFLRANEIYYRSPSQRYDQTFSISRASPCDTHCSADACALPFQPWSNFKLFIGTDEDTNKVQALPSQECVAVCVSHIVFCFIYFKIIIPGKYISNVSCLHDLLPVPYCCVSRAQCPLSSRNQRVKRSSTNQHGCNAFIRSLVIYARPRANKFCAPRTLSHIWLVGSILEIRR